MRRVIASCKGYAIARSSGARGVKVFRRRAIKELLNWLVIVFLDL